MRAEGSLLTYLGRYLLSHMPHVSQPRVLYQAGLWMPLLPSPRPPGPSLYTEQGGYWLCPGIYRIGRMQGPSCQNDARLRHRRMRVADPSLDSRGHRICKHLFCQVS